MNLINKLGLGIMGLVGLSSSSWAVDVAFDSATKTFTGDFNLTPYMSAITIVVAAIAVVAAIRLAIGQFKKV